MSIFRPVTAPQVIAAGIAVLLPVTIGPTVPTGTGAQAQAIAAYRGTTAAQPAGAGVAALLPVSQGVPAGVSASSQARAPWPYAQVAAALEASSQFGIAVAYVGPQRQVQPLAPAWTYSPAIQPSLFDGVPQAPTSQVLPAKTLVPAAVPWPHAATMLQAPEASQWGIDDADLIFDRLWPLDQRQPAPWPYAAASAYAAEPYGPAVLTQPAVYVPPVRPPGPQRAVPWPHNLAQATPPDTGALPPDLGTQIPPSPVLQWLEQPPYPHVATFLPRPTPLALYLPPTIYTWGPTINPVREPDWPYVATMLPQPTASEFGQVSTLPLGPRVATVGASPWPHASMALQAPSVATLPTPSAFVFASGPAQLAMSWAWPYQLAKALPGVAGALAPSLGTAIPFGS